MFSSISENILAHVILDATSRDIWLPLERLFASQSQAKVFQHRHDLASVQKDNLTIPEYVEKVQKLGDELAQAGHCISQDELINYLLASLGSKYDVSVATLTNRDHPGFYGCGLQNSFCSRTLAGSSNHRSRLGTLPLMLPLETPANNTPPTRASQLPPVIPATTPPVNANPTGLPLVEVISSVAAAVATPAVMANYLGLQLMLPGHTGLTCRKIQHFQGGSPPVYNAYTAVFDPHWYPNLGATHHLTHDINNFSFNTNEYSNNDTIRVRNGQSLRISNTGSHHGDYTALRIE